MYYVNLSFFRSQLCAVWANSFSLRPFEEINASAQKFDSLRLKYIGARIELIRLCRDMDSLQTFFSWTSTCSPDLPSLYLSSASGGPSRQHHIRENLLEESGFLWHVKRSCTMAIADVILFNLRDAKSRMEAADGLRREALMDILRSAYSCFLKLNCSVEDVKSWSENSGEPNFLEMDALLYAFQEVRREKAESTMLEDAQIELDSVEAMNKKLSLLQTALARCKTLFSSRKHKRKSGEVGPQPSNERGRISAHVSPAVELMSPKKRRE